MEDPKPATPVADYIAAIVAHERSTQDGMSPYYIRLGRTQRGLLNEEKRGDRNYQEIKSPPFGGHGEPMGTLHGLPVFVVDDESVIEIVQKKDAEEE